MGLPSEDQETHITYGRNDNMAHIYATDSMTITKLDKLVEKSSDWSMVREVRLKGELIGKEYSCPKNLISFRSAKRSLTDEQKQAAGERLRKVRLRNGKDEH